MNPVLIPFLATLAVVPLAGPEPEPSLPTPVQNIVLVVIDDLGIENLGWYPQSPAPPACPPTPWLQSIGTNGVTFSKFYTQPLCSPTRAAIMTGRYAFETGMGDNPAPAEELPTSWPAIPEQIPSTWKSAAFGKWHLGQTTGATSDPLHPIATGFQEFVGHQANVVHPTLTPNANHFNWWRVTAPTGAPNGYDYDHIVAPPRDESRYSLSVTGAAARAWITSQSPTDSYFAYICFNVPHAPFQVPPHTMLSAATVAALPSHFTAGYTAANVAERLAIYHLAIEALDTEIGRLLSVIDTSNTMLLVVGDNGTASQAVQAPYRGHVKSTVYDAGTRVPFLVQGPVCQFPGTVCSQLVSVVDVLPTVVSLAGGAVPSGLPGMDATSIIKNPVAFWTRAYAFTQRFQPHGAYTPNPTTPASMTLHDRGITDGTMHYLRKDFDPGSGLYVEEAYDLSTDPLENCDLLDPTSGCTPTPTQTSLINGLRTTMINLSGN